MKQILFIALVFLLVACTQTQTTTSNQATPASSPTVTATTPPTQAPPETPVPAPTAAATAKATAQPSATPTHLPQTAFFGTVTQTKFYATTGGFVMQTLNGINLTVYGPKPYTQPLKVGSKVAVDGKLNKNGAVIATRVTIQ